MAELESWGPCGTCRAQTANTLCEGCGRAVCGSKRCAKKHEACASPEDVVELAELEALLRR